PQRAALCVAAQHHEGEEEADRRQICRRLRRRPDAASRSSQDYRTGGPQGRRQGEGRRRTRLQAEDRSRGSLMTTLLIAEHEAGRRKGATNPALTAASELGGGVHVLVGGGASARAAADAATTLAGVNKGRLAEGGEYADELAEPLAD